MTSLREPAATRPAAPAPGFRWWRWLVVLAYMAAIFMASSQSGLALPGRVSDKVLHAGAYGMLSALIVWALVEGVWSRVTGRTVLTAVAACLVYGWSDEIHQLFVPNRFYEVYDLLADTMGAVLSAGALWAWGIISRGSAQSHGR